jgi:hypothetical protein
MLASNVASCVMLTDPALPAAVLADGSTLTRWGSSEPVGTYRSSRLRYGKPR